MLRTDHPWPFSNAHVLAVLPYRLGRMDKSHVLSLPAARVAYDPVLDDEWQAGDTGSDSQESFKESLRLLACLGL